MNHFSKIVELSAKLQESVLPQGWIQVGKVEAIPLIALDLYHILAEEERIAFCNALVQETFVPIKKCDYEFKSEEEIVEEVFEDIPLPLSVSPKQRKIKSVIPETGPFKSLGHTNTWYIDYAAWKHRPSSLLIKLREKILSKKQKADVYCFARNKSVYRDTAYPEMDSNEGPAESVVVTSNVVLGETQSESIDIADVQKPAVWHNYSTTEESPQYSNLTDRFTIWKTFTWNTESKEILLDTILPRDFVNSVKLNNNIQRGNMPMFVPFNIHQYMRGNIEVKLQVNSNKFQSGQLIAAWHYGGSYDKDSREHIASMVQLPHVIISAGASNEATLTIPYRNHVAFMHTKKKQGFSDPLMMGRFIVRPLVNLMTSTSGSKTCTISVFIRFTDANFTGLVDGSVANPEMDTIGSLVKVANNLLNAPNCDNPPANNPPKYLVPTASHSWSIGNGVEEPLHRLSLQSSLGFKHKDDCIAEDLRHSNITNKFGLLKMFQWNANDQAQNKTGSLLWSCNVHPQIDKELLYTEQATGKNLPAYYVPPCGVMAGLYEYWRGKMEFKFDIVATSFHTGRLLVAYIPGTNSNTITLEQARNSSHVVFSLQDSSTFTFVVPYISDRPWWKRKYAGPQRRAEFVSPSKLYVFVLNQLVPMESVSKVVTIVPYVRASEDFELSIPVQPSLGISWERVNDAFSGVKLAFKSGYFPVYVGAWHSLDNSQRVILRYGEISDHVAQVPPPPVPEDSANNLYIWIPDNLNYQYVINTSGNPNVVQQETVRMTAAVTWYSDGYYYVIPFRARNIALQFARIVFTQGLTPYAITLIERYVKNSDDFGTGNLTFTALEETKYGRDLEDYAFPEMEREIAPSMMQPTQNLPSTSNGVMTFGENFNDLKDLCRRYQLYWDGKVSTPVGNTRRDYSLLQLPIVPQGLKLDVSSGRPMWNSSRDGHIPIILSGFRYFRGGIRFRIVITNYDGMVWVQYRSDRPLDHDRVASTGNSIKNADRYRAHSYPFYIQDMKVNRVIEVEVPFYQPGIYGYLGNIKSDHFSTDIANFTSLGDLVIGVEGITPANDVEIAIYYSIADDFSTNTYIGFPPMVYCDETALPEMDTSAIPEMEFASGIISSVSGSLLGSLITTPVTKKVNETRDKVVSDIVSEAQKKIEPLLQSLEKSSVEGAKSVCDAISDGVLKQTLVNSIGQLMQVMLNPTPLSFAIAICSLLGSLVVATAEILVQMQSVLHKFLNSIWYKYFAPASDLPEAERNAYPEGKKNDEDEDSDTLHQSFFSMVFGSITMAMGLTTRKPKDWPSFTKGMKEDLGFANNATLFFKNSIEAIIWCYEYCIGETSDVARAKRLIEREYPSLKNWVEDTLSLLDPRRRRKIFKSTREANRVFDACQYGALIIKANLDKSCPGGKVILDLYTKICKLRDDLVEGGNHPNVRFEPFSMYVVGNQGIGKSFLTTEICKEMLQHIGYRSTEEMIYWLQLGQKYWNGIGNPAVVARDEAYAVDGTMTEEEIMVHMAMCSSSVFNPPMAAVEEKNKRINPLIYYMNSNVAFPTFINARCPRAIYRRRKVLVRAQYTSEILAKYPGIVDAAEISAEDRHNKKHLEFFVALDPSNPDTDWRGPLNYTAFLNLVKDRFKNYYEREQHNFKQRMRDNYCLDPDYDEDDDLEFINECAGTTETLRERMERDRLRYQDIIDDSELEDSFFQKLYIKAKNYYSHAFGEIGEDSIASTSRFNKYQKGFYSDERREQIQTLIDRSHLSKDVVQKLLSGTDIDTLSEDDIAGFAMIEDFMQIVNDPTKKYRYWVGTHHECIFKLYGLGSQGWGASEIAHSDQRIMGRWSKSYLPSWTTRTGTESLRCWLYWLMRQAQWLDIISQYDLEAEISRLQNVKATQILDWELDDIKITDLDEESEFIPGIHEESNVKKVLRTRLLLTHLKKSGMSRKVCDHCKVWCENIHDTKRMKYSKRSDKILYTDAIGLNFSLPVKCECNNNFTRLMNNKLFRRGMKLIWNADHNMNTDIDNPFRMGEYETLQEEATTFLEKVKVWFKEWWIYTAKPAINLVIRFMRDHVIAIISILLSVFMLYKSQTATTTASSVINGVGGGFFARAGFESAFAEGGPNYYRDAGVPRRGASGSRPAAREFVELDVGLEQKIFDNVCFLKCSFLSEDKRREITGRCLGIRNRQILVIRHYIEEFERLKDVGTFQLFLNKNGKEAVIDLDWDDFKNIRYLKINGAEHSSNFGIMELPKYVPMFRNIVSLIPTANMHKNIRAEADFLSLKGPTKRSIRIEQCDYLRIAADGASSELELDMVYKYAHHGAGLCGSVLISPNANNGNPGIIGMHVAGKSGLGYAEPLCREWFDTCIPRDVAEYVLPKLENLDSGKINLDGNMLLYGCVDSKFAHKESGKSQIVPSLLHGQVYPVKTEPNPLKPNDPRQPPGSHPLRDGCNKHGAGYPGKFEQRILDKVSVHRREVLINKCKPTTVKVEPLSLQQAICGDVKIPHCEALNWKSSEGFPLSTYRPKGVSGKRWLFDLTESENGLILEGINDKLVTLLSLRNTMRERGIVSPPLYIDCLKDYRMTPEKCATPGKTRIFSIAPVQTTIDARKYLGCFLSAYKSATLEANHGIGIDPDSLQWTDLVLKLTRTGTNIVTGDYKNFGPSLSSQLVVAAIENIEFWHKFYGASDNHLLHVKRLMNDEFLLPFHLCNNVVYQVINGIGSGSPITAELNSEVNIEYIEYSWLKIMEEKAPELATLEAFDENCTLETYGDDFIMGVSDKVKDIFNCQTISKCLKNYGITLTSADKGAEIKKYDTLENSTFLKRTFRKHPTRKGVWLAPIEEMSITECLNWCHKSENLEEATREVIDASLNLAFGHGPEYYENHRDKINKALILHNIQMKLKSWKTRDEEIFG